MLLVYLLQSPASICLLCFIRVINRLIAEVVELFLNDVLIASLQLTDFDEVIVFELHVLSAEGVRFDGV